MTLAIGRNKSVCAFTLIELLFVVSILVLLVALMMPDFSRAHNRLQTRNVADDLAFLMRYAQLRSITQQKQYRLRGDPQQLQYWLEEASSHGSADFQRVAGPLERSVRVAPGLRLELSAPAICFYPDGTIDKARVSVCSAQECHVVSTEHQRGRIHVVSEDQ